MLVQARAPEGDPQRANGIAEAPPRAHALPCTVSSDDAAPLAPGTPRKALSDTSRYMPVLDRTACRRPPLADRAEGARPDVAGIA